MKKLIAISLLSVFAVLQYGKMVSWIYCEIRVEISDSGKQTCDCDKILTDKQTDSNQSPLSSHSHTHKEKLNEPFSSDAGLELSCNKIINTSSKSFCSTDISSGFLVPPYHPPAIV